MCGITGIFRRSEGGPSGHLEASVGKLSHRGPDDRGYYLHGSLGMGHTRLSIIDLEGGRQPLYAGNESLVLIANGEIYNYIELRRNLKKLGHEFLTQSDSEVILHAYEEYGEDFLPRLRGMFAFALFDKRLQRLLLARDRIGIKPMFLAGLPDGVAFSSELKSLIPLLGNAPEIDPDGLLQYIQNQFSSGSTTILKGVERVLPGEAVRIERGRINRRWRYWSALDVKPEEMDQMEAQERFDAIMETAMVQHMRSDVPFGLFLSGGADSAILLALLSHFKGEPIRTFSVGFPGTRLTSELPAAGRMARRFSSIHTQITPSEKDIFNILPLTVWAADDLMRDYANMPTAILSATAAQELKVVFSGEGGDEVFAGYGRYRSSPSERFVKNLIFPGSGGFRTRGDLRRRWPRKLLQKPFLDSVQSARSPFVKAWSETPRSWSDLERMQYVDLVTALPDNLLVKADRMMMAFGLEGRVPFLDHRVVEFGLSLPDHLKVERGNGKLFLRKWALQYLPPEHLDTPKKGFHVPVGEWLNTSFLDGLRKTLPRDAGVTRWFKPEGILELINHCGSSPVSGRVLWSIIQFALWHRIFIEGSGERPPESINPMDILN
ncbi:MAG: asparagine synthase (glutamine-hydrolyzing) [bacterium]|nr:asparagine synthase (glutamine-hydrolyzing) [bacterium]MDT8365283.1 asparagine synthase (glutamine-hydrolyzing) [bacterium]